MMGAWLKVDDGGESSWMSARSTITILLAESCGVEEVKRVWLQ
jgi:hypothetical protein